MSVRSDLRAGVLATLLLVTMLASTACRSANASGRRMIVLGMDGLDPVLVQQLMEQGRLPNFRRLAEMGTFQLLETAASPQSPVAWSNFITGLDSGGHGIFDFLHRDVHNPLPFGLPYTSTSAPPGPGYVLRFDPLPRWDEGVRGSGNAIGFGDWILPLWGGGIELARHGTPFWELLENAGVRSTIVRIPANFPPVGKASYELSGMGTPDLRGTPGEFTFFSTDRRQFLKRDVGGGEIYPADLVDGVFTGTIYGPPDNPVTAEEKDAPAFEFHVYVDPDNPVAKFVVGAQEFILQEGEWSDWKTVDFELIPWIQSIGGSVRFYLESVRPHFELYVTPVQIDPLNQAMRISEPSSFAVDLAEATGRFYTQEMPEDSKAIENGVFDIDDYLAQARISGREIIQQYEHVLESWTGDFLFYYFGNPDQVSHIMWGLTMDPEHPAYVPEEHDRYRDVVPGIYEELDAVVGRTLDSIDAATTLVVMSDHGFASWRRSFHLNAWLADHGYLRLKRGTQRPVSEFWGGVAWDRTRAYGLGISGLYLNLAGRESSGIVRPQEAELLLDRIEADLLATVDPLTGEPAVTRVYRKGRDFHDRGHEAIGPDLVIGYTKGTRGSGKNALGGIPEMFISDNVDEWSGDHIMDHTAVPGVLFASRPLGREATSLQNLAAAILAEFGIEGFPDGTTPVTVQDN